MVLLLLALLLVVVLVLVRAMAVVVLLVVISIPRETVHPVVAVDRHRRNQHGPLHRAQCQAQMHHHRQQPQMGKALEI